MSQFFASGGQSTGVSLSVKEIVEYKDLELTVPHKHIKNTSTRETIFTEYQLKSCRSLNNQCCKKDTQPGRMKEKNKKDSR